MLAPRVPGLVLMSFLLTQAVHVANFFKKYSTVLATLFIHAISHTLSIRMIGIIALWGKFMHYDTKKLKTLGSMFWSCEIVLMTLSLEYY